MTPFSFLVCFVLLRCCINFGDFQNEREIASRYLQFYLPVIVQETLVLCI